MQLRALARKFKPLVIREDDQLMRYVEFHETKSSAQREADRKADELWVSTHKPVVTMPERPVYGADALVGSPAPSAH